MEICQTSAIANSTQCTRLLRSTAQSSFLPAAYPSNSIKNNFRVGANVLLFCAFIKGPHATRRERPWHWRGCPEAMPLRCSMCCLAQMDWSGVLSSTTDPSKLGTDQHVNPCLPVHLLETVVLNRFYPDCLRCLHPTWRDMEVANLQTHTPRVPRNLKADTPEQTL